MSRCIMIYLNGETVQVGDRITIKAKYEGKIVAIIDDDQYSEECSKEKWSYLISGLLINTDFGGIVHYQESDITSEQMELKK